MPNKPYATPKGRTVMPKKDIAKGKTLTRPQLKKEQEKRNKKPKFGSTGYSRAGMV